MTDPSGETEARRLVAPEPVSFAEVFRLLFRTWPFIKPVVWHVVGWFSLAMAIGVLTGYIVISGVDLIDNKVLRGEPVQPMQATVLLLDSSYVDTESLSDDQRAKVRNRIIFFGIFYVLLLRLLADNLGVVYWEVWIAQTINQNLRVKMIANAEHLSLQYQSHARTGDIIYRVFQDSRMISHIIASVILDPLEQGAGMIGAFVICWIFSPILGLIFLAACVPILLMAAWWTPRIQRRAWLSRQSNSNVTSRIQEVAQGIRVIKANQAEDIAVRRFDYDSNYALDNAFYLRVEILLFYIAMAVVAGLALILADYLMADWTISSSPTFLGGLFVAIVGFELWNLGAFRAARENNETMIGKYSFLFMRWFSALDLITGLNRAYYLLDLKPGVEEAADAVHMPTPIDRVDFENVSFAYEEDRHILRNVDLRARVGTITAVVGATGSGKSTLMSMLLRLYDPADGRIRINDTDLKQIKINDIRQHIAIALQQNVLFATSVAENIGYATRNSSPEQIREAARIACADEFIVEMSDGYDTELGERGGKLSTGQRQRLSVARAIVRDTPILILDEPTASLDAETEHRLLQNLSEWGENRIVFLITHRLSTIRSADQIALLKEGQIAEVGTHEELMALPDGEYRAFVAAETTGSEDTAA